MRTVWTCGAGILLLLALGTAAAGEVYRWVDDNGVLHYGDRPPKGADAERVQPERLGFDSAAGAQGEAAGDARTGTAGEDAGDQTERTARIRQEQCQQARERLESYRTAARMQIQEGDDETRDMTAEERVQAIARAEADVADLCEEGG